MHPCPRPHGEPGDARSCVPIAAIAAHLRRTSHSAPAMHRRGRQWTEIVSRAIECTDCLPGTPTTQGHARGLGGGVACFSTTGTRVFVRTTHDAFMRHTRGLPSCILALVLTPSLVRPPPIRSPQRRDAGRRASNPRATPGRTAVTSDRDEAGAHRPRRCTGSSPLNGLPELQNLRSLPSLSMEATA